MLAHSTLLALTGCGETTAPETRMTEAEAAALIRGLYEGELLVHGQVFHLGPYPSPVALPGRASAINATIPCANGGHATFEGVATAEVHAGQVTAEASGSLAARNCAFQSDGLGIVVDGDGLAQSIRITWVSDTILLEAQSSGRLGWAVGRRGGRCQLANTVTSRISLEAFWGGAAPVAQVSGTACGRKINRKLHLLTGS